MNDTTDYIVVGGGASGCAVTSALLKNNYEVNLFEAGYSHHNFLLDAFYGTASTHNRVILYNN